MPIASPNKTNLFQGSGLELDRLCVPPETEGVDRRIRKTRQRLQAGLLLLMKEKPLAQITMREICRRVDVGRSTPYTHYRDVEDILEQMEQALYGELTALFDVYPLQAAPEALLEWFTRLFFLAQRNGLLLVTLLCHDGDPAFVERTLALCEAGILGAQPADARNPSWRATFLVGALTHMVRQWVSGGCAETPRQMAEMTIGFLNRTA